MATLESRHAGMEASRDLRLVIESHKGEIVSGKHRLNPQLVNNLIDSLTSQMLPAPTPSSLGIADAWLKRNLPTPLEGTPSQKNLFQESFTDSKTAADLLPFAFKFVKFDDYPQLRVTITLNGGGQWVCSSSQEAFETWHARVGERLDIRPIVCDDSSPSQPTCER